MMNKLVLFASVMVLLISASVGNCALIEIEFSGQVSFVGDKAYLGRIGKVPIEGIVSVGDSFNGILRYDSSAEDQDKSDYSGLYTYDAAPNGISVMINNHTFMTNPEYVDLGVFICHDVRPVTPCEVWAAYSLNNLPILNGNIEIENINIGASTNYGKLQNDALLTTKNQFTGWDYINLCVSGIGTDAKALYFEGEITSISLIPEPGTIAFLTVGGLIVLIRRKAYSFTKEREK